ncbi:MAG: hypothetical protein QOG62_2539 [Thermoleophilaceae bacterium]|jgi:hypothetical protein|nr:hypothetical protein [Thermoleophilaceae bacterium]
MAGYTIKARSGARVIKDRFAGLAEAIDHLERVALDLARNADAKVVSTPLIRDFEPVQQVLARVELSGPHRLRAGIDVRGDGSTEAFTGKLKRELVEQLKGEDAYDALRRTLRGR